MLGELRKGGNNRQNGEEVTSTSLPEAVASPRGHAFLLPYTHVHTHWDVALRCTTCSLLLPLSRGSPETLRAAPTLSEGGSND